MTLVGTKMEILHARYTITARFPVLTSRIVNQQMHVDLNGKVEEEQEIPLKQVKTY